MQRCRHPQLVRFFGAGLYPAGTVAADKNTPFLVLELVDQGSLKSYLRKTPDVAYPVKHQIAWDVAEGIGFIHSLDSLHRTAALRMLLSTVMYYMCRGCEIRQHADYVILARQGC
jgi:serine/threonine protein kinase